MDYDRQQNGHFYMGTICSFQFFEKKWQTIEKKIEKEPASCSV